MNKFKLINKILFASVMCLLLMLCGCGDESSSQVVIDYGDAESFEAALNAGENLEGKVVRFTALELHPQSAYGYNVWAGEHLNFISSRNPDIKANDVATVRATTIESNSGSWFIYYEKVDNGIITDDTVTYSGAEDVSEEAVHAETEENTEAAARQTDEETIYTEASEIAESAALQETEKTTTASEGTSESTYEHNEYYDIVETASFNNIVGDTIVIHKVLAKQDASVSGTLLAYAADGSVIGKSSDDIILTEGQYNFFRYSFESDISDASLEATVKEDKYSLASGERNAVEMVNYNISGDNLYITLKQTGDNVDALAKFKILFYNEDKIVDAETDMYFMVYAENLNGKDSTDVAEIWVYEMTFDRIEYIYEP